MIWSLPSAAGWGRWDIEMLSCQQVRGKTACPGSLNHLTSAVRKVSFASGNCFPPSISVMFQHLSQQMDCYEHLK